MEIGKDRNAELNRLFRIYKTIIKMMMDRGYYVPEVYRNTDFAEFEGKFGEGKDPRDSLTMPFFKRENEEQKIYVFFSSNPNKFTKDDLKNRLDIMKGSGTNSAIIILQGETSVNLAEFEETYHIEFFKEEELLVNITEHELVSQHILISNEEKMDLLKRYKVKESQLPKILLNDPVARYYGLKRGDVVKIIRESETAGRYVTYRMVC